MRVALCLVLLCALLTGCSSLNISNPFESSSTSSEIYFDQFPDVPIPRDLSVDIKRSLVSVSQDGAKTGLLTVEGWNVDKASLETASVSNMSRQGWNLRGSSTGNKTLQLYEKGNRFAVLYFYNQTTTTAMEIWVLSSLPDGVVSSMGGSGADSGPVNTPSFYLEPAASGSSSGEITQQGLTQ